jgi:hypothetical protein
MPQHSETREIFDSAVKGADRGQTAGIFPCWEFAGVLSDSIVTPSAVRVLRVSIE